MRIKVGRDGLQMAVHQRVIDQLICWGRVVRGGQARRSGKKKWRTCCGLGVYVDLFTAGTRGRRESMEYAMKKVSNRWETSIQSNGESLRLCLED